MCASLHVLGPPISCLPVCSQSPAVLQFALLYAGILASIISRLSVSVRGPNVSQPQMPFASPRETQALVPR